ncbi:hypothetical protein HW555_009307 [Spodoptera exigua]|uniref:BPTI/Kunitz inhibitor domain-containing protein n=1 Tax=Spodoptera exigua TaxID=7107 RepID=A0A835GCQ6_SPOEX|nr:hypothetical protein HW555_009307 [Spodoptera exigua]
MIVIKLKLSILIFFADSRCLEPIDPGMCMAAYVRHAYNSSSGQCVMFLHGGCQPNGNNFPTAEECREACVEN